jgi:hypothetical protein
MMVGNHCIHFTFLLSNENLHEDGPAMGRPFVIAWLLARIQLNRIVV